MVEVQSWMKDDLAEMSRRGELIKPAYTFCPGENKVVVKLDVPRVKKMTKFGERIFLELVEPEGQILILKPFLYGKIVSAILQFDTARINIIKSGSEKLTKYDVKTWSVLE